MSERRMMKKVIGGAAALIGILFLLGTAGCLEAETMSIGAVAFRMIIGCAFVSIGGLISGGLE